jgi:hypothetical protein
VSLTAQQGIYAAFSAQLTKVVGFDLDLNLGSYNTPSSGSPYLSHGISVALNIGPVKVGGSWEQTSNNGGLSFESSPSNFIVGSLQASSEGLSLAFKPPQAFSGFQTQLDNPLSLLPTSDTPCTP